ncbi:5-hydroxytryptamine receptor 4 [Trichoplax sp. H2]|uniref:G-protein coupled receptors family 1 profile domain-containing protein n=1 Tax=Trichoplax adhaerens TaxID=10228 RepID=B3SDK6_TRIAD|nr:hypothetical protein TRIADDRAFT_33970 [Trichoplax adhaerens]EDV19205.1 hypothetical protein TRIADDRAFT_33970 [Trichoplax adhaerens]RDD38962.1 5-hydroxytryptamine receptor 4 [Trichoplax sp. H2]|eukprot:XP_002118325.1 hypothetical protein TRIADDRAFT_33970 [Trichoplax adhaerens]
MDNLSLVVSNDSVNSTSILPTTPGNVKIYTIYEQLILLLYFFTVMVVSVFGNLFVVIVIIKHHQLRTITNFFIINVAAADILVGALVMPFTIYAVITSVHRLTDSRWCIVEWFLSAFLPSASSLSLCCVSLDRFFAITNPYFYRQIVTKQRAVIGEILSWTIAGICASTQFTWTTNPILFCDKLAYGTGLLHDKIYMTVALCIVCFIPILLFIYIYGTIFSIAAAHAKKIRRDSRASSISSRKSMKKSRCNSEQRESKAAKATAIIVGAFVLCWLPFTIVMLVNRWLGRTPLVINAFTAMVVMGNSAINPILYVVFKRDIKCVVKKICCCKRVQQYTRQNNSFSTTHIKLGPNNSSLVETNSNAAETESYRF